MYKKRIEKSMIDERIRTTKKIINKFRRQLYKIKKDLRELDSKDFKFKIGDELIYQGESCKIIDYGFEKVKYYTVQYKCGLLKVVLENEL